MIAQHGLSILGGAALVTAPKVAIRQTIEEEEAAQGEEERGGGERIEDRGSRIEDRKQRTGSFLFGAVFHGLDLRSAILDPPSSILHPRSSILDPLIRRRAAGTAPGGGAGIPDRQSAALDGYRRRRC